MRKDYHVYMKRSCKIDVDGSRTQNLILLRRAL